MRDLKLIPYSLIWIAASSFYISPVMASNLDDGIRFYNGGRYAASIAYFKKEIAEHASCVAAHYYLANSLAELRQSNEAIAEYEKTLNLKPQGQVAKFCTTALANLTAASLSQAGRDSGTKKEAERNSEIAVGHTQRTSASSDAADDQETEFEQEANQRVTRINKEAVERIKALEVEREAQLEPYHYGKYGLVRQSSAITDPIKADYQKQIDSIKLCAKKEADAALIEAKQRSIALEDAVIDLHKAYTRADSSSVRLVPDGSNLYMRNYKTESAPSGNPVALIAPPMKALKHVD
jgi:tetratricopeptide (TPR) repeat protein